MNLLELAEYLKNVSEACRVTGVSRQHFYDIQKAYEEGGLAALREKSRRKPNLRNRAAPEVEEAVLKMAEQQPAYGQVRVSNELRKKGILISPCGVRSIWLRNNLQTFKLRLRKLEEKAAKEGIVFTEAQVAALERAKEEKLAGRSTKRSKGKPKETAKRKKASDSKQLGLLDGGSK